MAEELSELGYVIVSNLVVQKRQNVGFLYRESPDNKLDSGWRIFSGQEDEAYIDNPNNFGMYDPKTVLEIDPTIESLLDSPYKTAFERAESGDSFEQIFDFDFAEEHEEDDEDDEEE